MCIIKLSSDVKFLYLVLLSEERVNFLIVYVFSYIVLYFMLNLECACILKFIQI